MRPPRLGYDWPTAVCLCTIRDAAAGAAGEIMLLMPIKTQLHFALATWHQIKVIIVRLITLHEHAPIVHLAHPLSLFHLDILMLMRKLVWIDCMND